MHLVTAGELRVGADVSNWNGAPDASWDQLLDIPGFRLLSPQALAPPAGYPRGVTREQIQWGLDHGLLMVPYIWKWFGTGEDDIKRRLELLDPFVGQLDDLALDVEDTNVTPIAGFARALKHTRAGRRLGVPYEHLQRIRQQPPPIYPGGASIHRQLLTMPLAQRVDELYRAFEIISEFPTKCGTPRLFYTGRWYHVAYLADTDAFTGQPLWASIYDGNADVWVWVPFGGWTTLVMKQFAGTEDWNGFPGVDHNVLADDYLRYAPVPDPNDPGQTDPNVDYPWQARRGEIIETAGQLRTVASQMRDLAAEFTEDVQTLAQRADDVEQRADFIIDGPPPAPELKAADQ